MSLGMSENRNWQKARRSQFAAQFENSWRVRKFVKFAIAAEDLDPYWLWLNLWSACRCRYAFIHFTDEEVCRRAHDSSQELQYQNRTLVVMYGKKAGAVTQPAPPAKRPAAKKRTCSIAVSYFLNVCCVLQEFWEGPGNTFWRSRRSSGIFLSVKVWEFCYGVCLTWLQFSEVALVWLLQQYCFLTCLLILLLSGSLSTVCARYHTVMSWRLSMVYCLLHAWIQFYVLFLFETVTIMVSWITFSWSL